MIIYPIILIILLLILLLIIWRKAIHYEKGIIEVAAKPKELKRPIFKEKDLPEKYNIPKVIENGDFERAEDLFKKKQYISAERWYLEAAKKDPKNPKIYSRLAVIYLEQNNFKDARDSLEESVKLDPTVASRFFNLSFIYNNEGDKKSAISNVRKALSLDPENQKYQKWLDELKSKPF